jgi:hypothetical protein
MNPQRIYDFLKWLPAPETCIIRLMINIHSLRKLSNKLLVVIFLSPALVFYSLVGVYTLVENNICTNFNPDKSNVSYCSYPERFEAYRGMPTNFYRHIGSHFGRKEGTSASLRRNLISTSESNYYSEAQNVSAQNNLTKLDVFDAFSVVVLVIFMLGSLVALVLLTLKCLDHKKANRK